YKISSHESIPVLAYHYLRLFPRQITANIIFFSVIPRPLTSTLFPYTTLFRSRLLDRMQHLVERNPNLGAERVERFCEALGGRFRSEEHTSELQSRGHLVCRLLLEKKKKASKI